MLISTNGIILYPKVTSCDFCDKHANYQSKIKIRNKIILTKYECLHLLDQRVL